MRLSGQLRASMPILGRDVGHIREGITTRLGTWGIAPPGVPVELNESCPLGLMERPSCCEIVKYPHPALRYASRPVTEIDDELRSKIREMFELMYEAQGDRPGRQPGRAAVPVLRPEPHGRPGAEGPGAGLHQPGDRQAALVDRGRGGLPEPSRPLRARCGGPRRSASGPTTCEGNLVEHDADDLLQPGRPARDRPPRRQALHRLPRATGPDAPAEPKLREFEQSYRQAQRSGDDPAGRRADAAARRDDPPAGRPDRDGDAGCRPTATAPASDGPDRSLLADRAILSMAPTIRLIFLGTGDFALPTFEHLVETGHQVVALVTQPDRPQGRKQELIPSRDQAGGRGARHPRGPARGRQRAREPGPHPRRSSPTCWSRRPTARSSRPTCCRSPAWAGSTCTARSCRRIAGRRRWRGRSRTARPRPASPSSG